MASYPLRVNTIRHERLQHPEKGGKFGRVRGTRDHHGWDLSAPPGSSVYAVGPGRITAVASKVPGYGDIIQQSFMTNGAQQYWALYAHLSKIFCKVGDIVAEGRVLGLTGVSGNAKGQPPHLHFEVATSASLRRGRKNRVDPGAVLGEFLSSNDAGTAHVIQSGYDTSLDQIDLEELVERGAFIGTVA